MVKVLKTMTPPLYGETITCLQPGSGDFLLMCEFLIVWMFIALTLPYPLQTLRTISTIKTLYYTHCITLYPLHCAHSELITLYVSQECCQRGINTKSEDFTLYTIKWTAYKGIHNNLQFHFQACDRMWYCAVSRPHTTVISSFSCSCSYIMPFLNGYGYGYAIEYSSLT